VKVHDRGMAGIVTRTAHERRPSDCAYEQGGDDRDCQYVRGHRARLTFDKVGGPRRKLRGPPIKGVQRDDGAEAPPRTSIKISHSVG